MLRLHKKHNYSSLLSKVCIFNNRRNLRRRYAGKVIHFFVSVPEPGAAASVSQGPRTCHGELKEGSSGAKGE